MTNIIGCGNSEGCGGCHGGCHHDNIDEEDDM